jgi:hypothetical protein
MDENFRLYEWLAYHYHVLPLRYVVIAVDPGSVLSPEPVLGFASRNELQMTIITWTDSDFVDWEPLPPNVSSEESYRRYVMRHTQISSETAWSTYIKRECLGPHYGMWMSTSSSMGRTIELWRILTNTNRSRRAW